MTQTQTSSQESPDPDRRPDHPAGPDLIETRTVNGARTQTPDLIETRTVNGARTQTPDLIETRTVDGARTQTPDPDGPDAAQTTRTQTPDPDYDVRYMIDALDAMGEEPYSGPRAEIARHRAKPGPDETTRTQTARTQTVERAAAARNWFGAGGYLTALTVVVGIVASIGQKNYAETKAKFVHQIQIAGVDLSPWFAPFVFDLAVAALLHGGLRAARGRHSPWPWWFCGAAVAGLSIFTNFDHDGGKITGTASIGLFVIWGLYLLNEYKTIVRDREVQDSADPDFRSTDVLFTVDKKLADRAWLIARTKPLDVGLDYRHMLGETRLSRRDMVILAARLYNDVYADRLDVLLNPADAAPAGPDSKTKRGAGRVRRYHRSRYERAVRLATMIAGDAVDLYLGLPVPERHGVPVARVTYVEQDDRPLLGSVTATPVQATVPAEPPVQATVPAEPPVQAAAPTARRKVTAAPSAAALPAGEPAVVVADGTPSGNAGVNWLPLDKIPGLPEIDPTIQCRCHPKDPAKWCGKTLAEHVKRRGRYVKMVTTKLEDWDTRTGRIGKALVGDICETTSDGLMIEIGWVFDQLLRLAEAQRAAGDAAATAAATRPEIEGGEASD